LWKKCGKTCGEVSGKKVERNVEKGGRGGFSQETARKMRFFATVVERFTGGFTQGLTSVVVGVLHNFHRVYYYDY